MPDRPLASIRADIEALTAPDGRYALVCARTGERPTPIDGLLFATRADAARAARLAEQYRQALREYDPSVRYHDVVVCERPIRAAVPALARPTDEHAAAERASAPNRAPLEGLPAGQSDRVRFCHRLATALFEALRAAEHEAVELAVMDRYRTAADRVADPDALCLRLLDEIAIELEERLAPAEQLSICSEAASRLPAPAVRDTYAVVAAFERLVTVDLLQQFTVSPWFHDEDSGAESCAVEVRDYALGPRRAAITTLPITVDVLRRQPAATVAIDPAVRLDDRSWEFSLEARLDADPNGVARVPLEG